MAKLTRRDQNLLRDLWLYRYLNSRQVSRLHFGHIKLAQRRLRILTERNYLDRFRPEPTRGFQSWWYRLSRKGARVVADQEELPVKAVMPPTRPPKTMRFLSHHALTTDFRIWLREACESSGFGYRFIPSYEEVKRKGRRTRRVALKVPGRRRVLVPDGVVSLDKNGQSALFALEVDRGTEPFTGKHASAIEKKLQGYRAAFETETAEEHYGDLFDASFNGFRVLCLVPDEKRREGFLKLAGEVDLAPLVWVATNDLVEEDGNLEVACWLTAVDGDPRALTE